MFDARDFVLAIVILSSEQLLVNRKNKRTNSWQRLVFVKKLLHFLRWLHRLLKSFVVNLKVFLPPLSENNTSVLDVDNKNKAWHGKEKGSQRFWAIQRCFQVRARVTGVLLDPFLDDI